MGHVRATGLNSALPTRGVALKSPGKYTPPMLTRMRISLLCMMAILLAAQSLAAALCWCESHDVAALQVESRHSSADQAPTTGRHTHRQERLHEHGIEHAVAAQDRADAGPSADRQGPVPHDDSSEPDDCHPVGTVPPPVGILISAPDLRSYPSIFSLQLHVDLFVTGLERPPRLSPA